MSGLALTSLIQGNLAHQKRVENKIYPPVADGVNSGAHRC
jgi:hypothetical protein